MKSIIRDVLFGEINRPKERGWPIQTGGNAGG